MVYVRSPTPSACLPRSVCVSVSRAERRNSLVCSLAKISYLSRTDPFAILISRLLVGGWEDAMSSFFPSLQVFQEASNLFLELLGKLLTQSDDSEQTFRRDSLMVIISCFQISIFPVFSCVSSRVFLMIVLLQQMLNSHHVPYAT